MGKKKLSLKPVQRGFATTSVASKKPVEPPKPKEEEQVEEAKPSEHAKVEGSTTINTEDPTNRVEDWEDPQNAENAALQLLVDRLNDKAEKEVARILKAIEFDRRLSSSFPRLELNKDIRDRVLELALHEEANDDASKASAGSAPSDKDLLRFFVTHKVLTKLGFTDERILECLEGGLRVTDGWEEALEWMWLHLSDDECLSRGQYAREDVKDLPGIDGPLVETVVIEAEDPPKDEKPAKAMSKTKPPSEKAGVEEISLFQAPDSAPESEDSDADQPDLNKENQKWAQLMLEMDSLRIAATVGKKGKKGKSSGVILETPEMRQVKAKMTKIEKEYMFSRKEADAIFRELKAQRDSAKRDQATPSDASPASEAAEAVDNQQDTLRDTADILADGGASDEEEGGLFGNMLDEPAEPAEGDHEESSSTLMPIRGMPIPQQFTYAGNTPKSLLRSALGKSAKSAVITYAKLSGGSKAARSGVEIRWSPTRRRVWRMDDIACDGTIEAENYISLIVLHELSAVEEITGINWRSMPPAYKDLWNELEEGKKVKDDEEKRQVWGRIKALVEKKYEGAATATGDAIKTANTAQQISQKERRDRGDVVDEKLQSDFSRRLASGPYRKMRKYRENLPIASFREQIVSTLESSQVMVLSGETGCGKSTQLPSFLLEDSLAKGKPCKIFVTEPRRISAISLAQRVSQELGDGPGALGSNSSLVGYSIRLEAKMSAATRLAFVTNGIALRMLEGGSGSGSGGTAFDEVTHIIVDEVHERSIESDFLLIVLKSLIQHRPDLKVVLMSATLDAEKLSDFFGGCPYIAVPGRTFPVQVNYLEDAVQLADWHVDETSEYAVRPRNAKAGGKQLEWTEDNARPDDADSDEEEESDPTKLPSAKYSAKTVSTVNLLDSRQIPYDLIIRMLEKICLESQELMPFSQAVLVFLPGLAEIRKLNDLVLGHPVLGSSDFVVYPLHSTISSEGQSAVFDIPPRGVRKIVISTNIAETGVTIPDVTCVIDSGKHREMRYDEKRQISRLVEAYIARSNAKQRRGRAGRVQEGLAFHLFTKARHDMQLPEHPVPEMLRLSLQDLALRIKVLKVNLGTSIENVLSQALDPPSSVNIQRAIAVLVEAKALTANEDITPMGRLLSKLPMDVHLGKFLLVAALFRCLDPALTIAATLNSKSPFVTPFGLEGAADVAKKGFGVGNSDFLTIVNVFNSWRKASDAPGFVRTFCRKNFVSQQNLQQIEELRHQLLAYLVDSAFVRTTIEEKKRISKGRFSGGGGRTKFVSVPEEFNVNAENAHVLNAALASGLYPKILSLDGSGGLKTIINQQAVAIHPSSINFKVPKSEFGTSHLMYFTIMQSKRLYAWETGPVDDRALALLCGDVADLKVSASSFQLDRKIRYNVQPKTALAIKHLREQINSAMSTRLRGKVMSDSQERWFELCMKCLTIGEWDNEDGTGVGVV